jgi:hypothetical protein
MSQLLFHIGHLLGGFIVVSAPVIILLLILNDRDRREATLRGIILDRMNAPNITGLYTLRIRRRLLMGKDTVIINLGDSAKEQIWDTTMHLSLSLPPHVRLIVNGTIDGKRNVGFSLKVNGVNPFDCPAGAKNLVLADPAYKGVRP